MQILRAKCVSKIYFLKKNYKNKHHQYNTSSVTFLIHTFPHLNTQVVVNYVVASDYSIDHSRNSCNMESLDNEDQCEKASVLVQFVIQRQRFEARQAVVVGVYSQGEFADNSWVQHRMVFYCRVNFGDNIWEGSKGSINPDEWVGDEVDHSNYMEDMLADNAFVDDALVVVVVVDDEARSDKVALELNHLL